MFISTWVILVAGLLFAFPMIYARVKEHTELEDETLYVPFICCIFFQNRLWMTLLGYGWMTLATSSTLPTLHATGCGGNKIEVLIHM